LVGIDGDWLVTVTVIGRLVIVLVTIVNCYCDWWALIGDEQLIGNCVTQLVIDGRKTLVLVLIIGSDYWPVTVVLLLTLLIDGIDDDDDPALLIVGIIGGGCNW